MKDFIKEISLWIGIGAPMLILYEFGLDKFWYYSVMAGIISMIMFQITIKNISMASKKTYVVKLSSIDDKKRWTILIKAKNVDTAFKLAIKETKNQKEDWRVDDIRRIK